MSIPDEVVERCARAMMDADKHPVSGLPDDEFFAAMARACLEASRYGEMREALKRIELTSAAVLAFGIRNDVKDDVRAINDYAKAVLEVKP